MEAYDIDGEQKELDERKGDMKLDHELNLPMKVGRAAVLKRRKNRTAALKWKEHVLGYVFLAPSLVVFGIFLFYPLLKSIYLSLHITDARGMVTEFVGVENFVRLFTSSGFLPSLKVTFLFVLYTVPTGMLVALLLAAMTHRRFRGVGVFKFAFSFPLAISAGTGAVIWALLFHPSMGSLNYFLSMLGVKPVFWLADPAWALISVSIMTVWLNLGFSYIVLLSGLQGISEEIYDSAKIDGAGPVRTLRSIIFPLLSPTLFFLLIVSVIGAFQAFGQFHSLTRGGPMNSTNVIVYQIYQEAFVNFRFGIGSAQALVLFAMILILTYLQFKVLERKVHYQ